jgi:hypothetical protein
MGMDRVTWIAPLLFIAMVASPCPSALAATCTVPNAIANGQVADASKIMDNFSAVANCAQQAVTTTGAVNAGSIPVFSGPGTITSGNLTGDVTTSGGTATTLSNSGVAPGSYSSANITVDAKGRITTASSGSVGAGALVLLMSKSASTSSSLDFSGVMSSAYDSYVIEFVDLTLSVNATTLEIVFSTDGGSTWDTGPIYDTAMFQSNQASFSSNASLSSQGYGQITQGYSDSASNSLSGKLEIHNANSTNFKIITFQNALLKSDGNFYNDVGAIRYKNNLPITAFRIMPLSGSITGGSVRLYGMTK